MPVSVTLNSAIAHHAANLMVRHAEQCKLNRQNKSQNFNLDAYKTSPFLWRTQHEMLFPCRKYVAKVTEESERERGCDIPWTPGLLLQTWSAAFHPGSVCKLLFTHANAAFCCCRHQNGVVFLLFAQAAHQRTTQALYQFLLFLHLTLLLTSSPLISSVFTFFSSHSASAYI